MAEAKEGMAEVKAEAEAASQKIHCSPLCTCVNLPSPRRALTIQGPNNSSSKQLPTL